MNDSKTFNYIMYFINASIIVYMIIDSMTK